MLQGCNSVIPIHFANKLTDYAEVACIGNCSNDDSHLSLQKHRAETSNGLSLSAARRSLDKRERIPTCLGNSFILALIEVFLFGHIYFHFPLGCLRISMQVACDVLAFLEILPSIFVLVVGVDIFISVKSGIGLGEVEVSALFYPSTPVEDVSTHEELSLVL